MTSIVTNTAAQLAANSLRASSKSLGASVSRLTTGNAIFSASDDAAGLAIGTGLKTDVSTLQTAGKNAAQAISLLNVGDGALAQIAEILQRQKALAVQANSGTLGATERGFLDTEFQALKSQIDDIATQTNFNGQNLLDGSASGVNSAQTNTTSTTYTDTGTVGTLALSADDNAFVIDNTNASDLSLQGSLSGLTVSIDFDSSSDIDYTITINGVVYTAEDVNATASAGNDQTITLVNSDGAEIDIVLDSVVVDFLDGGNQTYADTVANNIETDLASVTVYQSRTFSSGTTSTVGFNTNDVIGTAVEGLTGSSFTLKSNNYTGTTRTLAPTIGAFSVTAETSSTDGAISVVIGGSTFSTAAGAFNTNGGDLQTLGAVTLTNADDSNETLVINFANLSADGTGLTTTQGAQAIEDGLNAGFGVGSAGSLEFQVGLQATDIISVSIADVTTTAIYLDSNNLSQTLSLTTAVNANTASAVLDNAINSVLSARASVGALQSRFGFASANLSTTITNLDASRGAFLDTDIAAESTAFAKLQVLQQAATSVLAQANLLPQNLLKLLG